MLKIGVIGTRGGWSSERLSQALFERTGFQLLVDMDRTSFDLHQGRVWFGDLDLGSLDGLVVKKVGAKYSPDLLDRLELLSYLGAQGVRIFSEPSHIMRVLNRLSCTLALRRAGIPMPPTTVTEDVAVARETVEKYGEAVFKPLYTSKARGMCLIQSGPQAEEMIADYYTENRIMYIQKRINLEGRDLGITYLGGEYLATYARCNQDSWNTTTANGGRYARYTPQPESIEVATRAQALFGLDFTSVDVAETASGPMVFEVSAFGGFRGVLQAWNIDAAGLYADYVLNKLQHG